ncbi:hypothetical protein C7E17_26350, partial [Stenotrophomonas maltophilia]
RNAPILLTRTPYDAAGRASRSDSPRMRDLLPQATRCSSTAVTSKLYTVIVVPKGARNAPILLTRTPYDAAGRASR